jgi:undecaprenyl diphosphate synthase
MSAKSERSCQWPLTHVAIIMDGNRRWADAHRKPRLFGHKAGVRTLKEIVKHTAKGNLPYLTVYAFSSENWNRSQEEVDYLFDLFAAVVRDELDELSENNVKVRIIGDIDGMPESLRESCQYAMNKTRANTGMRLQVALNYGARQEIAQAARAMALDVQAGKLSAGEINAETLETYLYTAGIPDPDLIIRTGGEIRLSNYLLWQAAYSELYVTDLAWPDFDGREFDKACEEFALRQRRWGGD